MGADMCVTMLSVRIGKEPDWEEGRTWIKTLIDLPWKKWPCTDYVELYHEDLDEKDPTDEQKKAVIEAMLKDLETAQDYWTGGSREVSRFDFNCRDLMITGGLSWGDAPTEAYRELDKFTMAGSADACGFDTEKDWCPIAKKHFANLAKKESKKEKKKGESHLFGEGK